MGDPRYDGTPPPGACTACQLPPGPDAGLTPYVEDLDDEGGALPGASCDWLCRECLNAFMFLGWDLAAWDMRAEHD